MDPFGTIYEGPEPNNKSKKKDKEKKEKKDKEKKVKKPKTEPEAKVDEKLDNGETKKPKVAKAVETAAKPSKTRKHISLEAFNAQRKKALEVYGEWDGTSYYLVTATGKKDKLVFLVKANDPAHARTLLRWTVDVNGLTLSAKTASFEDLIALFEFIDGICNVDGN